jgi:hypothetical protein
MLVRKTSPARIATIAVVAGAALGVASQLVVRLPDPIGLLGTLGGPWPRPRSRWEHWPRTGVTAWWAGAASMAAAVTAYYVLREILNPGAFGGVTVNGQAIPYLVFGLFAGAAMGILGASWRTGGFRKKVWAAGLLAGALGAEVIVLSVQAWRGDDLLMAVLQGGAAIVVARKLPGSRIGGLIALGIGAASAALVAGVILAFDLPLRLFG